MKIAATLLMAIVLAACSKDEKPTASAKTDVLSQIQGSWLSTSAQCGAKDTWLKESGSRLKIEGSKANMLIKLNGCRTNIQFQIESLDQNNLSFKNPTVVANTCKRGSNAFYGVLDFAIRKNGNRIELDPLSRRDLRCGVLIKET